MAWRGGEQQIAYLMEGLLAEGHEVLVACRKGSAFEAYCQQQQIPFKALAFRNSMDLGSALALCKICNAWQPDLMHAHSSKSQSIAWLADLLGNRIPLVLSRRVAFKIHQGFINLRKYQNRRLKKVISITEAVSKNVLPLLPVPQHSIVIHSGIELGNFKPFPENFFQHKYQVPEDAYLIGTAAAFTREKDYATFLHTAALVLRSLPDKPIYFICMGEGPDKQDMQALARQLSIADQVVFTGFLSGAKHYLSGLDLFLFTSKNEGLGSGILDAFASKVPVVSTAAGGIPEIVLHEKTGLLAPIGDSKALAREVQRLYHDAALAQQLVAGAFHFVKQFDKNTMAKKTMAVYREVIQQQE